MKLVKLKLIGVVDEGATFVNPEAVIAVEPYGMTSTTVILRGQVTRRVEGSVDHVAHELANEVTELV